MHMSGGETQVTFERSVETVGGHTRHAHLEPVETAMNAVRWDRGLFSVRRILR